jgi:lipopolysaccharide biosynthesis glycosyltransferase
MNNDVFPVYIGYDTREDIAYRVCEYSIYKNSPSADVKSLKQSQLKRDGLYTRGIDPLSSTEFTFTRFMVPILTNYQGWALFCDCDIVWDCDIAELFKLADPTKAVMVVKHDHKPTSTTKMDGKEQTQYPRKNWSSVILWNCEHPSNQKLTIEDVNTKDGAYLHRFQWLHDHEIGELPAKYNFLVGWNKEAEVGPPKAYHWTEGGPWFDKYKDCEYKDIWYKYLIEYAQELSLSNTLTHTPITWVTSLSREYYNYIANLTLPSWENLPGDIVFVWDDKPVDLKMGKNVSFFKEVVSSDDPWLAEGMGGTKADRFWKKSRTQIWAARTFKGLVIWLDADVMVTKPLTKSKAIELLHPRTEVWGTLNCGSDHPSKDYIDTGVVAFNSRHPDFQAFIRDYSTMWYDGRIFKVPQPYDHYAVTELSKTWNLTTYVPHYSTWVHIPADPINRVAMEKSYLKDIFVHYLGIDNKNLLNTTNGNPGKEKRQK